MNMTKGVKEACGTLAASGGGVCPRECVSQDVCPQECVSQDVCPQECVSQEGPCEQEGVLAPGAGDNWARREEDGACVRMGC